MKLTIQKKDLAKSLRRASSIASGKTIPILSDVLLVAKASALEALVTDTSLLSFRGEAPATVDIPGRICVNAKGLVDRVAAMPDGPIALEIEGPHLRVSAGERVFVVFTTNADDYPSVPETPKDGWIELNAHDFGVAMGKVKHAIAEGDDGRATTFMRVAASGGKMLIVATDGHRCARAEAPAPDSDFEALIHRKAVAELARLLEDSTDELAIVTQDGRIHFRVPGSTLSVTAPTAGYPPTEQFFPAVAGSPGSIVPRIRLAEAVRSASLAVDEKAFVSMTLERGSVCVAAEGPSVGSARDRFAATEQVKDVKIFLNWRYLLDALSSFSVDDIELDYSDALEPLFIRDRAGDRAYTELIMPVRGE